MPRRKAPRGYARTCSHGSKPSCAAALCGARRSRPRPPKRSGMKLILSVSLAACLCLTGGRAVADAQWRNPAKACANGSTDLRCRADAPKTDSDAVSMYPTTPPDADEAAREEEEELPPDDPNTPLDNTAHAD